MLNKVFQRSVLDLVMFIEGLGHSSSVINIKSIKVEIMLTIKDAVKLEGLRSRDGKATAIWLIMLGCWEFFG